MDTISYSNFRSHLASTLDKVNDDHIPIMITPSKWQTGRADFFRRFLNPTKKLRTLWPAQKMPHV